LATTRNSAPARCQPEASKQTLGPAVGQRFAFLAKAATKPRLPQAIEGSHADEVDVLKRIDHRTLPSGCDAVRLRRFGRRNCQGPPNSGAPAVSWLMSDSGSWTGLLDGTSCGCFSREAATFLT
jgi:hypothetical protein